MFRIYPACLVTIATCLIAVLPSSKTFSATNEPNNFASAVVDNLDPNFIRTITELAADIGLVGSDSLTVSNFLVSVDMKAAVEQQLASLKTQETEKKRLLENLQNNIEVQKQKIDMLKLTPQQLASIENYNRSLAVSEFVTSKQGINTLQG